MKESEGVQRYRELVQSHLDYYDEVDRRIETGFDYFGRPLDLSKSKTAAFVYHLYSESGELLYVGKTRTPLQRILTGAENHRKLKTWFPEVVSIELFRFHRENHALAAEAYDIEHLRPTHNISKPKPPKYRPKPTHQMTYNADDEMGLANAFYLITPTPGANDKLVYGGL